MPWVFLGSFGIAVSGARGQSVEEPQLIRMKVSDARLILDGTHDASKHTSEGAGTTERSQVTDLSPSFGLGLDGSGLFRNLGCASAAAYHPNDHSRNNPHEPFHDSLQF